MDWEIQDDGIIGKLLVPNDTSGILTGQSVQVQVDDEDDIKGLEGVDFGLNTQNGNESKVENVQNETEKDKATSSDNSQSQQENTKVPVKRMEVEIVEKSWKEVVYKLLELEISCGEVYSCNI